MILSYDSNSSWIGILDGKNVVFIVVAHGLFHLRHRLLRSRSWRSHRFRVVWRHLVLFHFFWTFITVLPAKGVEVTALEVEQLEFTQRSIDLRLTPTYHRRIKRSCVLGRKVLIQSRFLVLRDCVAVVRTQTWSWRRSLDGVHVVGHARRVVHWERGVLRGIWGLVIHCNWIANRRTIHCRHLRISESGRRLVHHLSWHGVGWRKRRLACGSEAGSVVQLWDIWKGRFEAGWVVSRGFVAAGGGHGWNELSTCLLLLVA